MVRNRNDKANTKFEKLQFAGKYSMKNTPIPKNTEYMKKLIGQMEKIVKTMRWKALFFLKEKNEKYKTLAEEIEFHGKEENYGFKSAKKPPPIKEMEEFEKYFYEITKSIVFHDDNKYGKFQNELASHINYMKNLKKVIIAADKSNNFYTCDTPTYRNLRNKNIEKEYKKASSEEVKNVDMKSQEIAKKLKLDNKVQKYTNAECFITLKDHKENFISRPECRLINSAKNELGKVVKIKIEEINREIRYTTKANQWQSTQSAIKWFKNIVDPNSYMFLKFDIVSFYPSIGPKLMKNAIEFARSIKGIIVSKEDEEMILQCRKSFLFCDGQPWTKIGNENFDVPMGSYDGAEVCELVGLYILHKLTNGKEAVFEKEKVGIYRDDGLAIIKLNNSGRTAERTLKPMLNKVFNSEGLRITIEPATQVTDYLDVKFNLDKHTHEPYRKPNDQPVYLNVKSNHPKHVINHIPKMIEQRLSMLSSNEQIFEAHKVVYEKALKDSGHKCSLKYQKPETQRRRKRSRKVIYFNPPYSRSVSTNVIKLFLNLIDKHFPKGHILNKCFNRNTVKATYCTLTNMKEKIGKHNSKVLSSDNEQTNEEDNCNCQKKFKNECPIPGKCNLKGVVYQADVHAENKIMKYYGSTEQSFKKRYGGHKTSIKNRPTNHTTLSSYIWKLKDKGVPFQVKWSIKSRGHAFSSGGRACDLCLTEKMIILTEDQNTMLNKRDELLETCRHRRKHLLVSLKSPQAD